MAIHILWQLDANGPETQSVINLLGAELLVSRIGDVIVDTEWQMAGELSRGDNSEWAAQLQHALFQPAEHHLELSLFMQGTSYSRKVWQELTKIPIGQVMTYSALAERLDSGSRAVASACRNNPYPGIIPCHRVVSKSGIGGFMGQSQGQWVELKRQLLLHERKIAQS